MNIMLVSVTERTKEIGIRKALGATKGAIVMQFLLEATTLTFFGGIIGVIFAVAISQLILLLVPSIPASMPFDKQWQGRSRKLTVCVTMARREP